MCRCPCTRMMLPGRGTSPLASQASAPSGMSDSRVQQGDQPLGADQAGERKTAEGVSPCSSIFTSLASNLRLLVNAGGAGGNSVPAGRPDRSGG